MQDKDLLHFIDGLYGYAMAITRNRANAEDLVRQTYARAIRQKGGLPAGSGVKSWLFNILKNIHRHQLKKQRTVPRLVELDGHESPANIVVELTPDPLARNPRKAEREWMTEAVQQLPLEFREIVVLREYEDLSYREIAGILDCPVGTVQSRLARARSRLRALLLAREQAASEVSNIKPNPE